MKCYIRRWYGIDWLVMTKAPVPILVHEVEGIKERLISAKGPGDVAIRIRTDYGGTGLMIEGVWSDGRKTNQKLSRMP